MSESRDVLLTEDLGPVRRLTMNRPESLNALDGDLMDALMRALDEAADDERVRVLILRGAGRAFCSGYDLNEDAAGGEMDAREWHRVLAEDNHRMLRLLDHPTPIVASVHSYCLAGGTDLMLACDLAVAADDAYFGYVDVRFGSGVVSMFLPWVIGVRAAKELLFTGEDRVTAAGALRLGLVNRVWDVAGFRAAMEANTEIGVMIETANLPARNEFRRITQERGLKAAIAWRDARYRDSASPAE